MAINSLKWNPNSFANNFIDNTAPLLDRTHTPRGAKKAIALERTFDKEKWYYPRKHPESFSGSGSPVEKDKLRGK